MSHKLFWAEHKLPIWTESRELWNQFRASFFEEDEPSFSIVFLNTAQIGLKAEVSKATEWWWNGEFHSLLVLLLAIYCAT